MKKFLSTLLITFCGLSSVQAATILVGTDAGYAPYEFKDPKTNEIVGFDMDLIKAIAKATGNEAEIQNMQFAGIIPALQTNMIDVAAAGMTITEERKKQVAFSDPYYESDLVIVVKKDGPYADATSLSDFSGAKITGQLNTFHYSVIDQIEGVDKQQALENFPAMIVALQSGKIDGYVSERPGAVSAAEANPDLTFV